MHDFMWGYGGPGAIGVCVGGAVQKLAKLKIVQLNKTWATVELSLVRFRIIFIIIINFDHLYHLLVVHLFCVFRNA